MTFCALTTSDHDPLDFIEGDDVVGAIINLGALKAGLLLSRLTLLVDAAQN